MVSAAILAVTLFVGVAASLRAQSVAGQALASQPSAPQWQIDAGGKMEFDVASVKRNKSGSPRHTNVGLAGLDEGAPNGGFFSAVDFPLTAYIGFAYKLTPAKTQFLERMLPKWATEDRFDIEARAQGSPSRDQMRLMMQSLLADRFKLVVHAETRQLPVLVAVLDQNGKTGPQLIRLSEDVPCGIFTPRATGAAPPPAKYDGWFTPCGNVGLLFVSGRIHIGSQNIAIEQLAGMLSVSSFGALDQDRPILDQTGLNGKFDFKMEFTPDPGGPAKTVPNFQPDSSGPTFLEALKEQLGLKLVPQTGPVEVLVVDHVEQPSEN
jgi:uncharacterized protein (TIGR03435 family)